eukprot:13115744-Alexandrium_andersonii.AAC.1
MAKAAATRWLDGCQRRLPRVGQIEASPFGGLGGQLGPGRGARWGEGENVRKTRGTALLLLPRLGPSMAT